MLLSEWKQRSKAYQEVIGKKAASRDDVERIAAAAYKAGKRDGQAPAYKLQ